ncbi:hypothetical protein ACJMK2_042522 [Sinanodonta woodiana]|uniref:Hexosyltransferase n=1 Tax=Sinanodonta woodiana TaxID=1069815 RepID=A0ABD3W8D7_SINWO
MSTAQGSQGHYNAVGQGRQSSMNSSEGEDRSRHLLISVELMTGMRSRTRKFAPISSRVLLKASITSVLLLTVAFIVAYSIILVSVSNRMSFMHRTADSSSEKSKGSKKLKFHYRHFEVNGRNSVYKFVNDTIVKWTIEEFNDAFTEKPKCFPGSKFIIVITSSPENSERRRAIRRTWCNPRNYNLPKFSWQCIFLIGLTNHIPSEIIIKNEIKTHGDILKGSYMDSYRNLTIKVMHGLNWVQSFCRSEYVLKTDDDVFVNTQGLHQMISRQSNIGRNLYVGYVYSDPKRLAVVRNTLNKWFVSEEAYPDAHYPPYASGMGYVLSMDVVRKMVDVCKYVQLIPNEDAYVGILADRLGIEPVMSGRFTLSSSGLRVCNYLYLIVIHSVVQPNEQYAMLNNTLVATSQCDLSAGPTEW